MHVIYDDHFPSHFPPKDLGNGLQFGGAIGYLLLPGVAYLLRDYRMIELAITLPEVLFLLGWLFLPESPRWLLLKGRDADAERVIQSAARCNQLPVNDATIHSQISHLSSRLKNVSYYCICT